MPKPWPPNRCSGQTQTSQNQVRASQNQAPRGYPIFKDPGSKNRTLDVFGTKGKLGAWTLWGMQGYLSGACAIQDQPTRACSILPEWHDHALGEGSGKNPHPRRVLSFAEACTPWKGLQVPGFGSKGFGWMWSGVLPPIHTVSELGYLAWQPPKNAAAFGGSRKTCATAPPRQFQD